jgi:hypothetical protein
MKTRIAPLLFLFAVACSTARSAQWHVSHVPPAEAAWFKIEFNEELPDQGRKSVPGIVATAIQVAMDDFLPRQEPPAREAATDLEADAICMGQRQAWDVLYRVSPSDDKVLLIGITLAPGACRRGPPATDDGATYAVDTRTGAILAIQTPTWQLLPRALKEEAAQVHFPGQLEGWRGYTRIEGNMAAAIQLALDDFKPKDASAPLGTSPEDACLYQRRSYNVTAAPAPDAIMLVRFDVDGEACPLSGPAAAMGDVNHQQPVETPTYAIDLRTMRVLTYVSYPRQRVVKN